MTTIVERLLRQMKREDLVLVRGYAERTYQLCVWNAQKLRPGEMFRRIRSETFVQLAGHLWWHDSGQAHWFAARYLLGCGWSPPHTHKAK